jgi:ATP-dependent Clp protease ATP-binding subunit ClpA
MFERYSILAQQAVMIARKEAGDAGINSVDTEHLLIGTFCVHPELLKQIGIDLQLGLIRSRSEHWHIPSGLIPDSVDLPITPNLGKVFERASSLANEQRCREIRTEHLLLSMFEEPGHASQLLADSGVVKEKLLILLVKMDCAELQVGTDASFQALKSILERGLSNP